jgi:hypothetical protein
VPEQAVAPGCTVNVGTSDALTVIVPDVVTIPHPPVRVTVYINGLPTEVVGLPLIVTTLAAQEPVTPAGKPVTFAFVAPTVTYVILEIAVFVHTVCASVPAPDVLFIVLIGVTVIVPVVVIVPQPPVRFTVYVNGLPTVILGDPVIVRILATQEPVTPVGNPVTLALVAPVVA